MVLTHLKRFTLVVVVLATPHSIWGQRIGHRKLAPGFCTNVAACGNEICTTVGNNCAVQGPQGPPGADGADGEDGMDGAPGANGMDGAPGPSYVGCSTSTSSIVGLPGDSLVGVRVVKTQFCPTDKKSVSGECVIILTDEGGEPYWALGATQYNIVTGQQSFSCTWTKFAAGGVATTAVVRVTCCDDGPHS